MTVRRLLRELPPEVPRGWTVPPAPAGPPRRPTPVRVPSVLTTT